MKKNTHPHAANTTLTNIILKADKQKSKYIKHVNYRLLTSDKRSNSEKLRAPKISTIPNLQSEL